MSRFRLASFVAVVFTIVAAPLAAQPFGAWLLKNPGPTHGYVEIPHSSAFDFSTGFTLEAWVQGTDSGACSSIAGKGYTSTWWVGICGTSLRSYIKGTPSQYTSGSISSDWTHVAVTYDGTTRKHYVDGELVGTRTTESGAMTTNTSPVRINSDVDWAFSFGNIDELRIWNVARTQDQIRSTITKTINAPQSGLVAVYHLDGNGNDAIAGHNGTTSAAGYLTAPVALTCGSSSSTQLCLAGARFAVTAKWWTVGDGNRGSGTIVPGSSADSGNIWFFGPNNWEVMVKVLNACVAPFNRYWVFAAGTTDQHFSLIVTDVKSGQTKRYFNYGGVAAPAITDTDAFATCP